MNAFHPKTLVVDDEDNIRFFLTNALEKYGHQITPAASGEQALELLRDTFFDIVILDLNLGSKIDGMRVLEAIRWRWPATVVIILTGHGSLESAMTAIQEGVDGYLLKPVEAKEIRKVIDEAVQRAQRRTNLKESPPSSVLVHGSLRMDVARYQLSIDERPIELTAGEFKLLHHFLSNPDRVLTPRELVRIVQGYEPEDEIEGREIIKWYIHRLRQKIECDPKQPRYLLNVRGVGYRLGN